MKASVIITTYNSPEWLANVLVGFSVQTQTDFEIVIADDGSVNTTRNVVEGMAGLFRHPIVYVWQADEGFQKSKILNKAIKAAHSEYLIFTDGDCIPRNDFVAVHLKYQEKGYFLSGGYFKLPMDISKGITHKDIEAQDCFTHKYLTARGLKLSFKLLKLTQNCFVALFMNWITPTKKTWNGHNSSGYKTDIEAVNGFNHEMKYGGLDRELGERLFNLGLFSKQIRYSAICLHLDHERGYASEEIWQKNNAIRKYNRKYKVIRITEGIDILD